MRRSRLMVRHGILVLSLLLAGCPADDDRQIYESNTVATRDIGFSMMLKQVEDTRQIHIEISASVTRDGLGTLGRVAMSTSDNLSLSVQGQIIEPESASFARLRTTTYFIINQSTLSLPATFQVMFTRDGVEPNQPDALETYVTLNAVFETLSPRLADIFSRDDNVQFVWALRDGDGNLVSGAPEGGRVWIRQQPLDPGYPSGVADFSTAQIGQDLVSRVASLPAVDLVQPDFIQTGGAWEIEVRIASFDGRSQLPVTFEIDPVLANTRSMKGLFWQDSSVKPMNLPITIR